MNLKTIISACLGLMLLSSVAMAETHTTNGKITSISVNDLSNRKGLDSDEKLYAIAVRLDSDPKRLLGLVPSTKGALSDTQKTMSILLQEAFLNDWQVTIRWESSVKSHAPVLSVTVTKK
jgi:hypothetical protein